MHKIGNRSPQKSILTFLLVSGTGTRLKKKAPGVPSFLTGHNWFLLLITHSGPQRDQTADSRGDVTSFWCLTAIYDVDIGRDNIPFDSIDKSCQGG